MDSYLLPVHNVQETSAGLRGLGEGKERGVEGGRARVALGLGPRFERSGRYRPRAPLQRLLAWVNRGSGRQARLGGAAVLGSIVKRNRESKKMFKTKGRTILWRRRLLVSKLCRQQSWLWILLWVYCVGSQAESDNVKNWGGAEGKSVPRRLRMAGKCHQGECSGTE